MTNKYIVKKCPSYLRGTCYFGNNLCQNISTCHIKQIVDKYLSQSHIPEVDDLKEELLKILQVEEVYK